MAGAAKKNVAREQAQEAASSVATSQTHTSRSHVSRSSSGPSQSARSAGDARSTHSTKSYGRYDGNRDPEGGATERNPATSRPIVDAKNFDLGMGGWSVVRGYDIPGQMVPRPKPSTLGSAVPVALNTYNVDVLPTSKVYQFDVQIGSGVEKRGLIKAVWNSKAMKNALSGGDGFIFDGNKLAWSLKPIEREVRLTVDMDAERGRKPSAKGPDHVRVMIRQTNRVRLDVLLSYMEGTISFDNSCLEAVNFLDHLLRETPSANLLSIKRSFYPNPGSPAYKKLDLGTYLHALKGVYQSVRIVHRAPGRAGLSVNVDVSNGMFWNDMPLHLAAIQLTGRRDVGDLMNALRQGEKSNAGQQLKKFRKLHVVAQHRSQGGAHAEEVIGRLLYKSAKEHSFEKDGKKVTIYDYFMKTYNVRIQYPDLPLVQAAKGKNPAVYPMEVLRIKPCQRYQFKLDERQTSAMIKIAVTPPSERGAAIDLGLKMLNWPSDPILQKYGMKINTNKAIVEGRLIPAPTVAFAGGEAKPGTSGRWDLKGKKFFKPNLAPLKSWAVCVVPGRRGGKPDKSVVENFLREFVKIYKGHGGKVENTQPAFYLASSDDVGSWVTATWNAAGNQAQARPQILVFILPDKDSVTYGRIKRSAECRYGVVSQCMQYAHVQKCQAQYISNVCMKFNSKLGGVTCRATGAKSKGPTGLFTVPTVIIGADVSHAAPGAQNPSMAALTMSMDPLATRYAAACETNGFRVEMITTDNINSMMKPLLQHWVQNVGGGKFPSRILYFRDGVSEGQYQHVLQQEVHDMKALIKTADPNLKIPFVVVVGSKRHHVRFFPKNGDRNGNALPGTLVESGVTNPFENDFYLCSHAAIKGTARPMHYQVIMNEVGMSNEELQTLIYEHCYQYQRATTPVSQHPAIYYAHIASNRAVPHDPKWTGSSDSPAQTMPAAASRPRSSSQSGGSQSGSQGGKSGGRSGGSSSGVPTDIERLMPMPNQGGIATSMWYI
jgi:eukaryotic translation initiation factor 2C